MNEILQLLEELSKDFVIVKAYVMSLRKSKIDSIGETWIDGQDVMQTLHISKRTLQTLRDNGTLPYSRVNGKFYYKIEDVEKLLESNYSHTKNSWYGNK